MTELENLLLRDTQVANQFDLCSITLLHAGHEIADWPHADRTQ